MEGLAAVAVDRQVVHDEGPHPQEGLAGGPLWKYNIVILGVLA